MKSSLHTRSIHFSVTRLIYCRFVASVLPEKTWEASLFSNIDFWTHKRKKQRSWGIKGKKEKSAGDTNFLHKTRDVVLKCHPVFFLTTTKKAWRKYRWRLRKYLGPSIPLEVFVASFNLVDSPLRVVGIFFLYFFWYIFFTLLDSLPVEEKDWVTHSQLVRNSLLREFCVV